MKNIRLLAIGTLVAVLIGPLAPIQLLSAEASSQTVTFSANDSSQSPATSTQSSGTTAALTANSFTRSGYFFVEWNTAADGAGTAYRDGQDFDFSSSITLHAQWLPTTALSFNLARQNINGAVSYTHLTLPTILRV